MENSNNQSSFNQSQNSYNEKLPEELAYKELGPKDKPPKKIPFLKIIFYFLVVTLLIIIISIAIVLIKNQKKPFSFDKLDQQFTSQQILIEESVSPAPKPTKNPCGYAAKLCPDGTLSEKSGASCTFKECEEASMDMNKFWKISTSEKLRTYENLDLNYSFQAPVFWRFIGRDVGANLFSPDYKCKNKDTDCIGANILILTSVTTGKTNVLDWLTSSENYVFPNLKNINNLPRLKIDKFDAVKIKDTGTSESYVFIYNDTVFILSYGASNSTNAKEAKSVFGQILSSFKANL